MLLKLSPFIFSLIFLLGLEFVAIKSTFGLIVFIILIISAFFAGKKLGNRWLFTVLPLFFTISSMALLYLISIAWEKQIFILISFLLYYLILLGLSRLKEYAADQTARGMLMATTVATIFFSFSSAYGIYLNFLIPLWILMLTYFVITIFVSLQYFFIIEKNSQKIWTYCLLLSLIMTEIIWTMNFWPFGYLTTGVISLILYYVLWDLMQSYFLNLLSKKRVVVNMTFFSVIIIVVLLSAKWLPII